MERVGRERERDRESEIFLLHPTGYRGTTTKSLKINKKQCTKSRLRRESRRLGRGGGGKTFARP